VLPTVRRRVAHLLAAAPPRPGRDHVLATLVRLLDTTWLRVGSDRYLRDNGSYGLSTLRRRHARLDGDTLRLSFVGKAGVRHEVRLTDRRVARVLRRCRELPGQELFRYADADGTQHTIGSADVNAWLAETAGMPVTAKDFRTWHGSVQALGLAVDAQRSGARGSAVVAEVARRLGNTPAVCRKAYIHPAVLALIDGLGGGRAEATDRCRWLSQPPACAGLGLDERRLLGLLGHARRARAAGPVAQPATSASTSSQSATKRSMPKRSRARRCPAAPQSAASARSRSSSRITPTSRGSRVST
jgi:DNA topoisomerase I